MGGQYQIWLEGTFTYNWTLDRNIWPFKTQFTPAEYYTGVLAESYDLTDPQTVTVHLRKGVHWQDKPPVNGRELTADDVQFNYDRVLGLGDFAAAGPNPFLAGMIPDIERVTATDKYTAVFKFKNPTAMGIYEVLGGISIGAPEAAKLYGRDSNDSRNAVGTGPWMLTEFVRGTSLTCSRNPNYWGYDERHPQNQVPYMDQIKYVAIPDISTALAAMRTGKIDIIADPRGGPTWQQAQSLAKTNPDIQQAWWPNPGCSVELRCDTKPFTDINVRKALQMAIDLKTIAKTHYGGTVDGTPAGLISPLYKGYAFPYDQWPAELQQEYSFNPDQAKKLLAEAGYPQGFKTDCVAASEDDMELLQIIKSEFKDIGVDMEIKPMDKPSYMDFVMAGKHDRMAFSNATGLLWPPAKGILRRTSNQDRENFTHNNDPKYDALVSQSQAATTMDEIKRLITEADRYAIEQHWAVNVFPFATPAVWQPWLKGYSGEAGVGVYQLARFWIDQELKKSMGH